VNIDDLLKFAKSLSPSHREDLAASLISVEVALAAGIRTAPPDVVPKILGACHYGWAAPQVESLLVFPYPSLNGHGSPRHYRFKVFPPVATKDGKNAKYLQPAGTPNRVYIPPGVDPQGKGPLHVSEGEKKALCLTLHGYHCVGLGGVWAWRTRENGESLVISDFEAVNWKKRDVIIVFDADIAINEDVQRAEAELAQELISRGARVFVVRLPYGPGCPKGVDDFLREHGLEAFRKLPCKPIKPRKKSKDKEEPIIDRGLRLTDWGCAERLVALHGDKIRWCDPWGKWLFWDGRRWAEDSTREVERLAKDVIRQLHREAAAAGDEERKAIGQYALKVEADAKQKAFISMARREPGIPILPDILDKDPWLLNVLNGTLNLKTGKLYPHRREDMITKLAGVEFDFEAECPMWWAFLKQIFKDNFRLIQYIQKAVGYALTGDTSEQVLFMLYGLGANGKSTFLEVLFKSF
jgi:hypothetical protein